MPAAMSNKPSKTKMAFSMLPVSTPHIDVSAVVAEDAADDTAAGMGVVTGVVVGMAGVEKPIALFISAVVMGLLRAASTCSSVIPEKSVPVERLIPLSDGRGASVLMIAAPLLL